jgi:hypothetical protein
MHIIVSFSFMLIMNIKFREFHFAANILLNLKKMALKGTVLRDRFRIC